MKHVVVAHRKLSFGGGERVMVEQVAALAELPVRVSVLFRKEPDKRDMEAELRARNPRVEAVLHLPGPLACGRWLWRERPDLLVLCNHKGVHAALPWLARLGLRIPTVVTLHEHYERHLRKYMGIRGLVDRWIVTWAFEAAVRAHLGPQPCAMIHPLYPRPEAHAVDAEGRRAARRLLGLPEEGLVLGYVGQIDGRKNPAKAVDLAVRIRQRTGRDLTLVFAGRESSDGVKELDRAIRRADPEGLWVRRLGSPASVDPVFSALDAYLMTSRNEGFFPIALIEALERGVPVVAPTVGGVATVLRDGEGGFLIPKTDDRREISAEALDRAADRLAEALADPTAWEEQRRMAHALGTGLTRGYDAAARFRDAVAPYL